MTQLQKEISLYRLALIIFLVSFLGYVIYDVPVRQNNKQLIEGLSASVKSWKDRDSLNNAKIETIRTNSIKTFLELKVNDSILKELQKDVSKFRDQLGKDGTVTNFTGNTLIKESTNTKILYEDTLIINDTVYIYPKYYANLSNKWINGNILASKDTVLTDLLIRNSYSVIIGEEKKGFLKKRKPFVQVINKNPYTETESLRTYEVHKIYKKRFGVGPYIGVGVNSNLTVGLSTGLSLQYNFIRF